jgi:hypothetical protein
LLKNHSNQAHDDCLRTEAKFIRRNAKILNPFFVFVQSCFNSVQSLVIKKLPKLLDRSGHDTIAACAPIHLFVTTARRFPRDARRNAPTLMIFTDDLENR